MAEKEAERPEGGKDMSFWDHLEALRQGLFRIIIALVAAFVVLFFLMQTGLQLVNIELSTQFMVHMRVTFMCAIILCCPYILFEIWRFIAPALYQNEKRATRRAFLFASFLFYFGIAVGYCIILPLMVNFFDGYKVSEAVINTISLNSYISTVNSTVLLFGIVFEIPTLVAALSQIGSWDSSPPVSVRTPWALLASPLSRPCGIAYRLPSESFPSFGAAQSARMNFRSLYRYSSYSAA